jgi:hypothetical protein
MSLEDLGADALRRCVADPPGDAELPGGCPPPEQIWDAVRLGPSSPSWGSTLEHAGVCPACGVAWRLAREAVGTRPLAASAGLPAAPGVEGRSGRGSGRWLAAAAALAAGLGFLALLAPWGAGTSRPSLRAGPAGEIRSQLDEAASLPRERFLLRWTGAPGGTRYEIEVTDVHLHPILRRLDLEVAEFTVPEAALASLGAGDRVYWQVVAYLPDGRRVVSATFVATVR